MKKKSAKTAKYVMKNGARVQVIRPDDPAKALRITEECKRDNDVERLRNLPSEVSDYTFMGWLGMGGEILDAQGAILGRIQPGDSFVGGMDGLKPGDSFRLGIESAP
jgi:hypothetical protein